MLILTFVMLILAFALLHVSLWTFVFMHISIIVSSSSINRSSQCTIRHSCFCNQAKGVLFFYRVWILSWLMSQYVFRCLVKRWTNRQQVSKLLLSLLVRFNAPLILGTMND
jgi:hypothetical protein